MATVDTNDLWYYQCRWWRNDNWQLWQVLQNSHQPLELINQPNNTTDQQVPLLIIKFYHPHVISSLESSKSTQFNVILWHTSHNNGVPIESLESWSVMMMSCHRNAFHITGPLWGESTGYRWIPLSKASDAELWWFLLLSAWTNCWTNNRVAGLLRRHYTQVTSP